jgi:hypothetical protein
MTRNQDSVQGTWLCTKESDFVTRYLMSQKGNRFTGQNVVLWERMKCFGKKSGFSKRKEVSHERIGLW